MVMVLVRHENGERGREGDREREDDEVAYREMENRTVRERDRERYTVSMCSNTQPKETVCISHHLL